MVSTSESGRDAAVDASVRGEIWRGLAACGLVWGQMGTEGTATLDGGGVGRGERTAGCGIPSGGFGNASSDFAAVAALPACDAFSSAEIFRSRSKIRAVSFGT